MPQPQSIDALLAAAKQSLGNADALEHQTWMDADLASRPDALASEDTPYVDPTGFQQFAAGATRAASTYGSDLVGGAEGLGGLLLRGLNPGQAAADEGLDLANRVAEDRASGGSGVLPTSDALTGLPVSAVADAASRGDWGALAGHVASAATLAALLHEAGAGPEDTRPIARVPEPGELRAPAAYKAPIGPEPSPTAAEPYTGGKASSLKQLLGSQPQTFDAPAARTPIAAVTGDEAPLENTPYRADATLNDRARLAEFLGPTTPASESQPSSIPGDFTWDMSDFADEPAGSRVGQFTLDDIGSSTQHGLEETPPAAPSALSKLFKPRIGAAEAADNLRNQGSVMGDMGDISRNSAYPEDEADATHRLGFYLEDKALDSQWRGLLAEYRDRLKGGGGDATTPPAPPDGGAGQAEPTVRLYRGESDASTPGPLAGQTFTDNPLDAMYYAKQGGGAGRTYYIDLPESQAAQYRTVDPTGQGVHILPNDLAAQARGNVLGAGAEGQSVIRPTPAVPTSLKEMLDASIAQQDADRAAASASSAPAREGRFTLPQANVPDEAYVAAARRLGVDPSRVAPDAVSRPLGGAPAADTADTPTSRLREFLARDEGSVTPANLVPDEATREKLGALAQAHQAGSLLMSPLTVGRIAVSNTAAALQKAAEMAADTHSFAPVKRTLGELLDLRQMGRDAADAFRNPDEMSRLGAEGRPHGMFGVATRAVGAVDRPFRNAMERAGFSPEDALSVTQQRTPLTATGKHLLRAQQGSALTRMAIPFAKSGINLFEQGIVEPAQAAGRILTGESRPSDLVKVGSAVGSGIAGYEADKALKKSGAPNWLRRLAFAGSGLYEVPVTFAQALAEATNKDSATGSPDYLGRVFTALQKGASNLPVIGPGLSGLFDPQQLTRRIVPRALNPDYYTDTTRDTHNVAQKIEAQVPGLAQLLRIKRQARGARAPR